jgi:hypothetical protein
MSMLIPLLFVSLVGTAHAQTWKVGGYAQLGIEHGSGRTDFSLGANVCLTSLTVGYCYDDGYTLGLTPEYNGGIMADFWLEGTTTSAGSCTAGWGSGTPQHCSGYIAPQGDQGGIWHPTATRWTTSLVFGTWCQQTRSYYLTMSGQTIVSYHGPAAFEDCGEPQVEEEDCTYLGMHYDPVESECYGSIGQDPILIPTTPQARAFKLTDIVGGVMFDMDSDGTPEPTAWTKAGEELAFLAIDKNGNGRIDDGSELIGNNTVSGSRTGFSALKNLGPINGSPGSLNEDDPAFQRLLLWTDRNHNGISEPGELQPASDYISQIGLSYALHNRKDQFGNRFQYEGWIVVRTRPGKNPVNSSKEFEERKQRIFDVVFVK